MHDFQRAAAAAFALILGALTPAPFHAQTASASLPSAPEDGGPRRWEVTGVTSSLNMRDAPSTSGTVVAELPLGTTLDNLGCVEGEARIWCDVQPTGGGPRGYVAYDFLAPSVGPDGRVAMGYDDSAYRAGLGEYDATGTLPCAIGGQPVSEGCPFGVARGTGGDATVMIERPDAPSRAIFFMAGEAAGAGTSEADPGDFSVTRRGDTSIVRVGEEAYEIPDAVPLGG